MNDPLEIELKLDIEPADRDRLGSSTLFKGNGGRTDHLVSTYFDTPELALRDAGYSLRLRRKGGQRIQTVKTDRSTAAGLFVRPEWERTVDGDTPVFDETSGPLSRAIGDKALKRLGKLFVTDVHRTVRAMSEAGAAIEFAIDEGEIRARGNSLPLCEIELELGGGSPRALFDLARRLNEEVPLRLGVQSKAERGYNLVERADRKFVKAEPIMLDPQGHTGDAFRVIAHNCMRQFRLNEALLLETGEVEPLHQARVGIRRLRSAFSLFKPLLQGDARGEFLKIELWRLAVTLGSVRNLDVLIPRVGEDIRDRLAGEREKAMVHLRAELLSARTRLLMIDLAEWLMLGSWRMQPAGPDLLHRPVAPFASDLLDARRRRIKRRGKDLATLDDAHRHEVRIEAKKLRYAAEYFASLYMEKKARRRHAAFLGALEKLQDHLGELNDLVTGPQVLEALGITAELHETGKHERERLLDRTEDAFDGLIDARRFWR